MTITRFIPQKLKNYYHLVDSHASNLRYGSPAQKLKLIGITGTDGKTTTSNLLYEILTAAGKKVGLISSINAKMGDKEMPLKFHVTTPDPSDIMKILKKMVTQNIEYVVLETTSHALDQRRVGSLQYIACGFTNITREHLDYHKTFEAYRDAKARLLRQTVPGGVAVLNADDQSFEHLENAAKNRGLVVYSYGINSPANIRAQDLATNGEKQTFEIIGLGDATTTIELSLPGIYNVSNSLAAAALAHGLGISFSHIKKGIENMRSLNGRWEVMQTEPIKVVVDFAHTPNALKNALVVARSQVSADGKVHVVFGSAGRRDFTKRPIMGQVAGELADYVYITAEDPRDEDVNDISHAIVAGTLASGKQNGVDCFLIPDRKEAIKKALSSAQKGDIVLISGKGHELSMNLDGKTEIPWSDQKVVKELLA